MSSDKKTEKEDPDFVINDEEKSEEKKAPQEPKPAKAISVTGGSRWKRFTNWYKSNKKKSVPLTILVVLGILAAFPFSRYHAAALVLKNNFNVEVADSTTGTPISGADVNIGDSRAVTDGNGKAVLHNAPVGSHKVLITKKYYKDSSVDALVPILKQKGAVNIKLAATGRQVKVSVKNLINHTVLADVTIKAAGENSKTDKQGNAVIVLPIGAKNAKASLSLDGYNDSEVNIAVDDKTIKENNFMLTPSGKVYFLSKLSGKIDVAKTNLDGSGRQTVLAGTGKEDNYGTVLLASRDWKYLALLSKRDGAANSKLYIINTSNDKLTTIEGTTEVSAVGWSGDYFVYQSTRLDIGTSQPHKYSIKSYNAENSQTLTLDQNDEIKDGDSPPGYYYAEQFSSVYLMGSSVAYIKTWNHYPYEFIVDPNALNSKSDGLYSIKSDGSGAKSVKTWTAKDIQSLYAQFNKPDEIYITAFPKVGNPAYMSYNGSGVKDESKDEVTSANNQYSTYLASPSGDQTFWTEVRDGKNSLFIGDDNGDNGKQIASLSVYQPYGWYTDDYLLVSKNSSELYIMPKSGLKNQDKPIKITDYHKPQQSFFGYGGGYGGI
jgi:hypothetical protein